MSFSHFDVFISLWRMAERKLAVSCCFLSFSSLWQKAFCPSTLRSNTCTKSHYRKYGLYLHVFTRCCPATSFWYNEKIKKSYWTTVKHQSLYSTYPFLMMTCHVLVLYILHCCRYCVKQVKARYFRKYKMCVKLPATLNIQLEYVFFT